MSLLLSCNLSSSFRAAHRSGIVGAPVHRHRILVNLHGYICALLKAEARLKCAQPVNDMNARLHGNRLRGIRINASGSSEPEAFFMDYRRKCASSIRKTRLQENLQTKLILTDNTFSDKNRVKCSKKSDKYWISQIIVVQYFTVVLAKLKKWLKLQQNALQKNLAQKS